MHLNTAAYDLGGWVLPILKEQSYVLYGTALRSSSLFPYLYYCSLTGTFFSSLGRELISRRGKLQQHGTTARSLHAHASAYCEQRRLAKFV